MSEKHFGKSIEQNSNTMYGKRGRGYLSGLNTVLQLHISIRQKKNAEISQITVGSKLFFPKQQQYFCQL